MEQENILRRTFNSFDENVVPEKLNIPIAEPKNTLNKDFWKDDKLKQEIRVAILKVAKSFNEYLKLGAKIKDVIFTGSLANYNWNSTSDVDVHLILNLESLGEPIEFLQEYINAKKTIWNDKHNIKIKGFDVEVFAKDKESLFKFKAVYSVLRDKWIQKPSRDEKDINESIIKEKAANIMNEIDLLETISDNEKIIEKSDKIKDKIKKLRQVGLEEGGEFSTENLIFKTIRKAGYLDKLDRLKGEAFDSLYSLNEKKQISENKKETKKLLKEVKHSDSDYEYGCLMLDFKIKNWNDITKTIKKEDIYNKEGYGIEHEPHTTVLYGFHSNEVTPKEIENVVKNKESGKDKISVTIKNISCFENKDFDVVKFDIESSDLNELNKELSKFPNTNDYPDYHAHMTIAYVKSGMGKKYVKKLKNEITLKSGNFSYSYPPHEKMFFSLNSKKEENTLGVEKNIDGMTPKKVEIIKNFINFVCNRLELEEPVEIYLHKGRDEYIRTTASYVPSENSNHIRCENRALVDILRSIAHEMTHNRQREIKSFDPNEEVQTIGGWIEDEANAKAGILIKDFAMKHGFDEIYDM